MAHARKQIREAVASVVTGLTTTGSDVFQSRVYPVETSSLPCLLVYTTEEETTDYNGTKMLRELLVMVEGYAKATSDVDDTMDLICEEVETAIFADPTIGGLCKFGMLDRTEITLSGEGEKPLGKASMEFKFIYHVDGATPGTIL